MSVPTQGETFSKLLHHLREAQDCAAMMGHLYRANDDNLIANGWLGISELLKRMCGQVTNLAMRKLQ